MDVPFIVDKEIYKIMKYLYRHQEVRLGKISRKFGEHSVSVALSLCPQHYAAYRDEQKRLTFDITSTSAKGSIGLTPLGNQYVEDRRRSNVICYTPILLSAVSVIVSIVALLVSIFFLIQNFGCIL